MSACTVCTACGTPPAELPHTEKKTPRAPDRAQLPLLRLRPGGVGQDAAAREAPLVYVVLVQDAHPLPLSAVPRDSYRAADPSVSGPGEAHQLCATGKPAQSHLADARSRVGLSGCLEVSPSGLWRTLGKRVGLTPSGVRISLPPPVDSLPIAAHVPPTRLSSSAARSAPS